MIREIPNPYADGHCFFCGPANPASLKLTFFYDDEADLTFTDYTPESRFCGRDGVLHGGIQMALLDEIMWWSAYASTGEECAVTAGARFHFLRPVPVEVPLRLECSVKSREGASINLTGRILNAAGKVCTAVRGEYRVVSPEKLKLANGSGAGGAS
ncbi:PaaI family thioesterase [Pseudodesulfovibrio sp.]|uniref:PaaI family thioesterase n=1 Tax=unclassified Pseudodesulfovibrio TaxID=2661612 RepID=UPI003B002A44